MTVQRAVRSPLLIAGVAAALALAIGLLVGFLASPASRSAGAHRDLSAARRAAVDVTSTPTPSEPPAPPGPGRLGTHATLEAGNGWILGAGSGGTYESDDGGLSWAPVGPPAGASSLVVDPASAAHRLAGGGTLLETRDGGKSWSPVRTQPPGPGPFTPLAINPTDPGVWFVSAHGALLRTRDSAVSWRSMTGLPAISNAIVSPLGSGDRFALAVSGRVFDFVDNGNQITELKPLPRGVTPTQMSWLGNGPRLLVRGSDGKAYIGGAAPWTAVRNAGSLASVSNGRAWIADAQSSLDRGGSIWVTSDSGGAFTESVGLPAAQSVEAVVAEAQDGTKVVAYLYGGDVYGSMDGGLNWSLLSSTLRSP